MFYSFFFPLIIRGFKLSLADSISTQFYTTKYLMERGETVYLAICCLHMPYLINRLICNKTNILFEFVFNIPPTAKVIWRWDHGLESHMTDWRSWGLNSRPLGSRQMVYPLSHIGSSYHILFAFPVNCISPSNTMNS